ncbi:hypothetical protein BTHERMOSOX_246 [Bathymodiolus thermophilus thioautotrophic gill symbiont]|nr:hypothetical protein BTHERMOSOX_246 [Bathymodiolus thermophilus thioautotrophic gill symbiont]
MRPLYKYGWLAKFNFYPLENCQVGKKWIFDDYSYLCKGL